MEVGERNNIIKGLMDCIGEAIDMDSDDSDKDHILLGLTDLCMKATYLPVKRTKKKWVKTSRKQWKGQDTFLTTDLLLSDDVSYKNYLKVTKEQFKFVLSFIEQDIKRSDTAMRDAISPPEKLALTLRFLATGESFRSLDSQTQLSSTAISGIIPEVCRVIVKRMRKTYLKFPNGSSEWEAISGEFAEKWDFPNCLGALAGKYISFRPPRRDEAFYLNYNDSDSIILMALADANFRFTFVDIGFNGINDDASLFMQTDLKRVLEDNKEIPQPPLVGKGRVLPYVVVGDDALPLQTYLMKPYPCHTSSKHKQIFNARLCRARHVIEHSFGILTNHFRVFMTPINLKVETIEAIIYACCTLHNFILQTDDTYLNSIAPLSTDTTNSVNNTYNQHNGEAEAIRQQFTIYFNKEGKLSWL